MNNIVLIGRLTKDPELRYIPGSGTAVSTFGLAVDKNLSKEKKKEFESQNKYTADFFNIVVWGKSAENCANYLAKGRLIGLQGRVENNNYVDKDGKTVYGTNVVATQVEFLEFGNKEETNQQRYEAPEGFYETNDDIPF